jgi:CHAT domain-containing protein
MLSAGGLDLLRRQVPLPETVDELCRVARFTGGASDDVVVGAQATETGVKAMSDSGRLADARVVHFATHGLLAGETAQFLASKAEPSLLLTPPETASDTDDGLLTASEVANLRLDADWVVLSACNTASGDDIGAEALSGLARAFFYAGARSLLVSHWAVDSESTVKLVTSAFEAMGREPGLSQGQALSRAMAALIGSGGREAHPSNWAPFVVVGGSAPVATPVAAPLAKPTAATPTKPAAKPESRPSAPRPALKPKPPSSPEDDWRSEALGG